MTQLYVFLYLTGIALTSFTLANTKKIPQLRQHLGYSKYAPWFELSLIPVVVLLWWAIAAIYFYIFTHKLIRELVKLLWLGS